MLYIRKNIKKISSHFLKKKKISEKKRKRNKNE